jgi:hypothetical protein
MRHSDIVSMIKSIARERLTEADGSNDETTVVKKKKVVAKKQGKREVDSTPNEIDLTPTMNSIDHRR